MAIPIGRESYTPPPHISPTQFRYTPMAPMPPPHQFHLGEVRGPGFLPVSVGHIERSLGYGKRAAFPDIGQALHDVFWYRRLKAWNKQARRGGGQKEEPGEEPELNEIEAPSRQGEIPAEAVMIATRPRSRSKAFNANQGTLPGI
jgi:hypothetical protein